MSSQTDLDQGGTLRQWVLSNMGPSIGLVRVPLQNILDITGGGTYNLDISTTLVRVNSTTPVTVVLPSAANPAYAGAGMTQPGKFANPAVIIADVGGNALATPITIQANNINESIMGAQFIPISHNFAAYILQPVPPDLTWTNVAI